ncbi:hypothetical protein HanPI659440_Chr10g0392851 [Helianthus annuus]|nr:hypothetical protein HanPI659440_Chr10g0392851 [Helianthus annuus]
MEAVHFSKLVQEVVAVCEEPRVDIFDVKLLRMDHNIDEMKQLLQIAKDCVSIVPNQRPTMQEMLSKMEDMWLWTDHSEGYDYTPSTETHDTPSTITL